MTTSTAAPETGEPTISLSENQTEALTSMLQFIFDTSKKIYVLKGFSGTGKTTLINHLIKNITPYTKMMSVSNPSIKEPFIQMTATTNKAAQVLEEKTGWNAQTIHTLLELSLSVDYKTGKETLRPRTNLEELQKNFIDTLILMDEASMASKQLLALLNRAMHSTTKVILIGDPYQLAPVNEKYSHAFMAGHPEFNLKKVQRQAEDNSIVAYGDQIRETINTGIFSPINYDGKNLIHLEGPDFQTVIDEHFSEMEYSRNNKILAWTNNRVIDYNAYVRKFFTKDPAPQPGEYWVANSAVHRGNTILIANNAQIKISKSRPSKGVTPTYEGEGDNIPFYEVTTTKGLTLYMPQDINQYQRVLKGLAKEARQDKDWTEYYRFKRFYADIRPSYALTVHKSQGSTFDNVYIDLYDIAKCNKPDDVARMLYVAVTRAKKKAYFYGYLPDKYTGA